MENKVMQEMKINPRIPGLVVHRILHNYNKH